MVRDPQHFPALDEAALRRAQEEFVRRAAAGRHPVRDVEIEQAVPVHVRRRRGEPVRRARDPGGLRHVHEHPAVVAVEAVPVLAVPAVAGHVEVGIAVAVVIEKERGPTAAGIEEPGIERGGRKPRRAVLAEPVPVERVGVADAQRDEIEVPVAIEVRPAAAAGARPALDAHGGRDLPETDRGLRAAVRDLDPVALRQRRGVLAGPFGRDPQIPARLEQVRFEVHGLAEGGGGRTGRAHPQQRRAQGSQGGRGVRGLAQRGLEICRGRCVIAEPLTDDPPPVVLAGVRAVKRDGAGQVVVGAAQAGVAALDVGEADVEMGPDVRRVEGDRVLEELDGAVAVAEAHHPEAVLEVFFGFLAASVGRRLLRRGGGGREQRKGQRGRQDAARKEPHPPDDTKKGRGPGDPRPEVGYARTVSR